MKGAVERQPPGSTGTAALSALFSLCGTNKHANSRAAVGGKKKTLRASAPRMVRSLQNKRYPLLGDQETVAIAAGPARTCLWRRSLYQLAGFVYNTQCVGEWEYVFRLLKLR